jgi:RNA polymerase sigma-70 factor (ECF subfamily)
MKLTRDHFDRLALEHLDMLYRLARRLTRDTTRAEDLVQETYVRALKASENFELNEEFGIRPWLIRIMHNLHFSRSQREKRQPKLVEDEFLETTTGPEDATPPKVDLQRGGGGFQFNFDQMDDRLVEAIGELPQEYQVVLLLWAVEELSYKEIADAVDVPLGTVMSRLHRARSKLAEKLGEYAKQERVIPRE